ncbi:epoxide hydrolase [Chitinophaga sp. Mgbs1]|uniref:Epoxide hydrolase n=1 Tax=Chitinophaga solisilvae TaxID=1233460 RepID=A0A433WH91_9BACT|nr:epoxide hydrolase [Chitinophaga solisilvae]
MANLQPFKIDVAQDVLDDLKTRLAGIRWPDSPEADGWQYGANPAYLKELADYWLHQYDWRQQEALLNSFPQFKAEIDGVEIHFLYIKGKGASQPLLLTHEWPDSFFRFYKVIPLLTAPEDNSPAFDLIIPSIPGYGFSARTAVTSAATADIWAKLMTNVLGYTSFFAAGDFSITHTLAAKHPEVVKAIHVTDLGYPNGTEDWSSMTPEEQAFGQQIQHWFFAEGAFNMIQSTKPQTLGYSLNDSPIGLAAWIIEKFYAWSDTKGNMENSFTKDEMITNLMIYWVTQTINTSIRRYREDTLAAYAQGGPQPVPYVTVPTGLTVFPADSLTPEAWAARRANIQSYSRQEQGGRFAALEVPQLWVNEIRRFFGDKTANQ